MARVGQRQRLWEPLTDPRGWANSLRCRACGRIFSIRSRELKAHLRYHKERDEIPKKLLPNTMGASVTVPPPQDEVSRSSDQPNGMVRLHRGLSRPAASSTNKLNPGSGSPSARLVAAVVWSLP